MMVVLGSCTLANAPSVAHCQPLASRIEEGLRRNVNRFRGGLVFKAHRLVYHSTLGSRVIKKEEEEEGDLFADASGDHRAIVECRRKP